MKPLEFVCQSDDLKEFRQKPAGGCFELSCSAWPAHLIGSPERGGAGVRDSKHVLGDGSARWAKFAESAMCFMVPEKPQKTTREENRCSCTLPMMEAEMKRKKPTKSSSKILWILLPGEPL